MNRVELFSFILEQVTFNCFQTSQTNLKSTIATGNVMVGVLPVTRSSQESRIDSVKERSGVWMSSKRLFNLTRNQLHPSLQSNVTTSRVELYSQLPPSSVAPPPLQELQRRLDPKTKTIITNSLAKDRLLLVLGYAFGREMESDDRRGRY